MYTLSLLLKLGASSLPNLLIKLTYCYIIGIVTDDPEIGLLTLTQFFQPGTSSYVCDPLLVNIFNVTTENVNHIQHCISLKPLTTETCYFNSLTLPEPYECCYFNRWKQDILCVALETKHGYPFHIPK